MIRIECSHFMRGMRDAQAHIERMFNRKARADRRLIQLNEKLRKDNQRMFDALEQIEYGSVIGESDRDYGIRCRTEARKGMGY